jgi:hypothetical protein
VVVKFRVPDNFVPGSMKLVVQQMCDPAVSPRTDVPIKEFRADLPMFFAQPTTPPSITTVSFQDATVITADQTSIPLTSQQSFRVIPARAIITIDSRFANVPASMLRCLVAGTPMRVESHEYHTNHNFTKCRVDASTVLTGKISMSNGKGTATTAEDYVIVPPPSNATFATTTARRGEAMTVQLTNGLVSAFGATLKVKLMMTDAAGATHQMIATSTNATSATFTIPRNVATGRVRGTLIGHYGGDAGVNGSLTITE